MNKQIAKRAIFLDRDGVINAARVINGKPYPPLSLEDFEILPGVAPALKRLKQMGFLTIIVTNQPDVETGKQSIKTVMAMHDKIKRTLRIDDIAVCFCKDGPGCDCYKPSPKMLVDSAVKWNIDLTRSYMVGDRWRDVGAGSAAGCTTFLVSHKYKEKMRFTPDFTVASLLEASDLIFKLEERLRCKEVLRS